MRKFTAAKEAKRRSRLAFGQVPKTRVIRKQRNGRLERQLDKELRQYEKELESEDRRGYPKGFK